jgi:DNA-binding NtrC family response regulator
VDDDPADLKLFARELRKLGLDVIETTQVDKAVAEVVAGRIGCVVSDVSMPVRGEELLELLGKFRGDVSTILISGAETRPKSLPPDVTFISKGSITTLKTAVMDCMARYRTYSNVHQHSAKNT